jgi:flagellar hook-length control protein FliK
MKITENALPVERLSAKTEWRESQEDFSLILDKAVAKTQEEALDYEQELLRRDAQSQQEIFSSATFVPAQLIELQAKTTETESPQAVGLIPRTQMVVDVPNAVGQTSSALQPVVQQAFQQLAKVFDKQGVVLQPGLELRTLFAKHKTAPVVVPFEQLYAELVKQTQSMKLGSTLRLKLVLEPEKLGIIDVYMVLDNKKQLAVMFAAQDETKRLLENSGQDLAQGLAQNGYSLNGMQFMDFSGQGHQECEKEFIRETLENPHTDAETLNIWGQNDIMSSVNAHLASVVVNYVT